MSDGQEQGFRPNIASRLAILESELSASASPAVELSVAPEINLGLDAGGTIWLTLECEPNDVATDDRSPAVVVESIRKGARIKIAKSIDRTIGGHFLDGVIELVDEGVPHADAPFGALQRWRELLARAPGSRLSEKALVGLYGELEVLETILDAGGELDHWTGWQQDHNDFRLPGLAVEVKSTLSADFRRVEIHGLRQLDDPEDGSDLYLVLRRLERSPEGRSVPELTEAIVRRGGSRSELLERLSRVGYSEQHRASYENSRFASEELVVRRVDDGHPRLTTALLERVDLSAIDKIDYVLNLNAHHDHDVDDTLESIVTDSLRKAT